MPLNNQLAMIIAYALPLVFAITVHEAAHGYAAKRFGDNTAQMLGRLTLNPIKHIDPMGTIIVPLIFLIGSAAAGAGGFVFGWAKPVPVNTRNLKNPMRDMAWVAAAGPASNVVMALIWAVLLRVAVSLVDGPSQEIYVRMCMFGVGINLFLALLNMLPIPPLDGGKVASGFLPYNATRKLNAIEPYGFYIIIGLMLTGILGKVFIPIIGAAQGVILKLVGF